jgi:uncharacterized membrane protein
MFSWWRTTEKSSEVASCANGIDIVTVSKSLGPCPFIFGNFRKNQVDNFVRLLTLISSVVALSKRVDIFS